jgi:hypothetical protein
MCRIEPAQVDIIEADYMRRLIPGTQYPDVKGIAKKPQIDTLRKRRSG